MRLPAPAYALALLCLASCGPIPASTSPAAAHYELGAPYQLGGVWYYPADHTEFAESGLVTITPDHAGLTADGERYDATALTAAHHTLQLPAIARVTNLENGRQVVVRLNDRGPVNPGRILGLTRHAAELLGAQDGTQCRLELEPNLTRSLIEQVGGGPKLEVAAAPRAGVAVEQLAPPPGIGQSARGRTARENPLVRDAPAPAGDAVPNRLPDQVTQSTPQPGSVLLLSSEFGRIDYANRVAAQLSGLSPSIKRTRDGRSERYGVRAGPFPTVAAADAALDQARRAGVIDSRLVVE